MVTKSAIALVVGIALAAGGVRGQTSGVGSDTVRASVLSQTLVTADRAESSIGSSISAASIISAERLTRLPGNNLADALRLVPGFTLIHLDGLGHDPQMMVRGFHGAGRTGYVQVLVDGRPVTSLPSGLMRWDLIPPVTLSSIEVVRGPASALYGDAAVGGVVNLISAEDPPAGGVWDLRVGAPKAIYGSVWGGGDLAFRPVTFYAGVRRSEGYREHAARTLGQAGGEIELVSRDDRHVSLSVRGLWQDYEIPGPLPESEANDDPQAIAIIHSYDAAFTWLGLATLEGAIELGQRTELSGELSTELRRRNEITTLEPGLDQGDTKERSINSKRLLATAQVEHADIGLPWSDRLIVGGEASLGTLDAEHLDIVSGGLVTYVFTDPTRPVVATGSGGRNTTAAFAQYELWPVEALRVSLGGRFDRLSDSFAEGAPNPAPEVTADHSAFSPRAGANLRWINSARHAGHLHASASRTFRAPTPDELFDQRVVPVPIGGDMPISNVTLVPEEGTSVEIGASHDVQVSPSWGASVSLALYEMDMENEISLDVATNSYDNIDESRHRGVEAGVTVRGPSSGTLFANYSLQEVTVQSGANSGNALKAIPRHTFVAGVIGEPALDVEVGLYLTRHGDVWLDDENTQTLAGFTRVDVGATYTALGPEISFKMMNVLGASYSTAGFLDPGGTGTPFLYPAAGRVFELGVRVGG